MKHFFPQIPFWAKVGKIPTSYRVAMSYEEQLLWLCKHIEELDSQVRIELELALKEMEEEFYKLLHSVEEKKDLSDLFQDGYAIEDGYQIGQEVDLTPEENSGYTCAVIPLQANKNYELTGHSSSLRTLLWVFLDSNNRILDMSHGNEEALNAILEVPEGATKLVLNCNLNEPHYIYEISYNSIENFDSRITTCENNILTINGQIETINGEITALQNAISHLQGAITTLSDDITLEETGAIVMGGVAVDLKEGIYFSGSHRIYNDDGINPPLPIVYENEIFIYIKDDNIFLSNGFTWQYQTNSWVQGMTSIYENTLTDSRLRIPTCYAVYQALQNISPSGVAIHKFDGDVTIMSASGNIIIDGSLVSLESGFYLCNYPIYLDSVVATNRLFYLNEIVYYDSEDNAFYGTYQSAIYDSDNNEWNLFQSEYITNEVEDKRNRIITAHAVYNAIEIINRDMSLDHERILENEHQISNLQQNEDKVIFHNFSNQLSYGYYIDTSVSVGTIVNTTPQALSPDTCNMIIKAKQGDRFKVSGKFPDNPIWCFTDSDFRIITKYTESTNLLNAIIQAPANTSYLIYNATDTDNFAPLIEKLYPEDLYNLINGKNKLRMNPQTISQNGITLTIDNEGLITIDGTATSTIHPTNLGKIVMTSGKNYICNFIYVSGSMGSAGGAGMYLSSSPNAYSNAYGGRALQANNRDFPLQNVTSDTGYLYTTINNGQSFTNFKMKVQIVEGITADYNYSEYTGGLVFKKDIESY